jgi:predicted ATPase
MFDIMVEEENYEEALSRILALLQRMGETFPTGQNVPKIIEKEFDGIRKSLRKKDNKQLLTPPKNSDKKSLDALFLLATLVDISEKYNDNYYKELAIMRMMHLSLKFGYSRQYPLAFALFGVYLVQQGFIKEVGSTVMA